MVEGFFLVQIMSFRSELCVTVSAPTMRELRAKRDAIKEADLVELRLDSVSDPDVAGALADRQRPVIITCRPGWEGGWFRGSEEERHKFLFEALDLGAEYIDVEWQAGFDKSVRERGGQNIILSMHDFNGTPTDLVDRYLAMRSTGAQVVKLAVFANRLSDALSLLRIGRKTPMGSRVVLIAMGVAGIVSRILAGKFGSCWTYAGDGVAPGQIEPERLLEEFRFRKITEETDVYGVLGAPLLHSLSPAMHNAGFDAIGQDACYVPFEAKDVEDFVDFAKALNVRGVSVTAPFKQQMLKEVAEVDDVSRTVGALNTIRMDGQQWQGLNTDVSGFLAPLSHVNLNGVRAAILGSGGAARAVSVALASRRAKIEIYARNFGRSTKVAQLVGGKAQALPVRQGSWDLLVNATPVGTFPHVDQTPAPEIILDGRLVYDLVYNPLRTRLIKEAELGGCQTIGGLDMLVAQAERQFEWWTGERPETEVLRSAALRRMG